MKQKQFLKFQINARIGLMLLALVTGNFVVALLTLLVPFIGLTSGVMSVVDKEIEGAIKEIAKENREALEKLKLEFSDRFKGLISSKELEDKMEAVGLKDASIKKISDIIEKQGLDITALMQSQTAKGNFESLEKFLVTKKDELKHISKSNTVKFTVPKDVVKTVVARTSVASNTMGYRLPDIGQLPTAGSAVENSLRHVQVGPDSNGVIRYIDQLAATRNAAWVAESGPKPESAITWQEYTLPIEKVADSIPVTKEAYADLSFVRGEIERLLQVNIENKVEDDLINGTGVTPIIKGLKLYAPTFTVAAPYLDAVADPNIFDLIAAVATYIANGKDRKYKADVVYLNPVDIWKFKVLKSADGHYLLPPFVSQDGLNIAGIKIIETSKVTQNTMVVGDSRYATIYELEDINIEMGWVNDQFIKNQFTILAERRLALLVRTVDLDAWAEVTSISAAIAALNSAT